MRWWLGVMALAVAGPGMAQDVDCDVAGTQMELTYCAEQDWIAADADLNEAYKAARGLMRDIDAGLPEAERGAEGYLREAQTAWITLRDAGCAAEGFMYHGGSIEPMVIYACRARMTEVRAAELTEMASTN